MWKTWYKSHLKFAPKSLLTQSANISSYLNDANGWQRKMTKRGVRFVEKLLSRIVRVGIRMIYV